MGEPRGRAVVAEELHKSYGDRAALRGLSFEIDQGEVFALLGPNGAGKTTTVEILEGHRSRDAGAVSVLGVDPAAGGAAYRSRIGIVLQAAGLEEELTPRELLAHYGSYYPRARSVDELVDELGLGECAERRIRALSGGQRRRLDLALALVGDPEVLFLDEPTTGFDPVARRSAWALVERLRGRGVTIVLTTHSMEEAEALADRVAILVEGRIVACGTPAALGTAGGTEIRFRLDGRSRPDDLPEALRAMARVDGQAITIPTAEPTNALQILTTWAVGRGAALDRLSVRPSSLEDVYLHLTAGAEHDE